MLIKCISIIVNFLLLEGIKLETFFILLNISVICAYLSFVTARFQLGTYGFNLSIKIAGLHGFIYMLAITFLASKYTSFYDSITVIITLAIIMTISLVDIHSTLMPKQLTWSLILFVFLSSLLSPTPKLLDDFCTGSVLTSIVWGALYIILNAQNAGSLGKGDVYFMAGIGGWLGFTNSLYASLIALVIFSGSIMTLRLNQIRLEGAPLGPFLSIGAVVTYCLV